MSLLPHISFLVYVVLMFSSFGYGKEVVPCYFIFGASYFDNGNNNLLPTLAKANFLPYGIDFPQKATGRFSNGRIIPDFIAELLGFNNFIPSYASVKLGGDMIKGVNYASGSSGIRPETGQHGGMRISMDGQLKQHKVIVTKMEEKLGNKSASDRLQKCLFSVAMGDNDYISNYFVTNFYNTSRKYSPKKYAVVLIQQYSKQLKTLYNYGARKIFLFKIPPLGCCPAMVAKHGNKASACADQVNGAIQLFNDKLNSLVDDLNKKLPNAKFITIDTFHISLSSFSGFKVTNAPCCQVSKELGTCIPLNNNPCKNRSEHLWWDAIHQTEASSRIIAEGAYKAKSKSDAYPVDISQLAQQAT